MSDDAGRGGEGAWDETTDRLAMAWAPAEPESLRREAPASEAGGVAVVPETIGVVIDEGRDEGVPFADFSLRGDARSVADRFDRTQTRALDRSPGRAEGVAKLPFPAPGEVLSGFRILSELGRGAFGRVYLAEQVAMANRRVALKVTRAEGDEYRALARLQHTHIVPIHSVHDDPVLDLRLLCMPYLGGANLAQVLEAAGARLPSEASGRSLVEALDEVRPRPDPDLAGSLAPPSAPSAIGAVTRGLGSPSVVRSAWRRQLARMTRRGVAEGGAATPADDEDEIAQPARRFLRHASYTQAAVWIAARLAEGLDHAHSRGLLHRDLKPSNVLIADDGTPMLLDFNLAAEAHAPGPEAGTRAMLGGTLPYMAPEHLDAFNPRGSTPPGAVDERSDLYALGLILFEMIAGHHPFADPPPNLPILEALGRMTEERLRGAPSIRAVNPQAPWSLDAILRKCLDPDPARRYQKARDLAEDLRRFLDDLPSKFAPEPSLRERVRKWARRNPRASSSTSVALLASALILAVSGVAWTLVDHLEVAWARLHLARFEEDFRQCQLLLNTTSGPVRHLGRGIERARRAIADYGIEAADWADGPLVRRLTLAERQGLREDLAELILLESRARVLLAQRSRSEADRRRALERAVEWLDRAETIDPHPSAPLFEDRARYLAGLGQADRAEADRARAAATPPTSGRDFAMRGHALLARNRLDEAERELSKAVAIDPKRFWAWFALGLCRLEQGRNAEAAADFSVCAILSPDFAWPHLDRGIALARAGRLAEARAAYTRALEANPRFVEALVDRGLACLELDDPAAAERDMVRAMRLGRRDPAILAARAEALARLGRRADAEREFAASLATRPDDPIALVARGFSRVRVDAAGARADFDRVLARDPRNARARLGLAHLAALAGDPRAALAEAGRALEADPRFDDAFILRALLRARLGDHAALADVDRILLVPSPARLYNAASVLAALSRTDGRLAPRALDLLRRALAAGYPAATAAADPDLAPLRARPEFREIIGTTAPR